MFPTRLSLFAASALKSAPRPPPPPPLDPLYPPTRILENVIHTHGPQTVSDCWKHAEPMGIKSKIRMKALLMWLVRRGRIRQIRHYRRDEDIKEFLYGPPKKTSPKE